jgi:hypothetical protein
VTRVNLTQVDSAETKRTAYHGFGDVTRYRIESNEAWPKGGRNNLHKRHKRHLPFFGNDSKPGDFSRIQRETETELNDKEGGMH